jgi:hypothetical protein
MICFSLLVLSFASGCSVDPAIDEADCSEVCAAIESRCGARPPRCEESCQALGATERRCVLGACEASASDGGPTAEHDGGPAPQHDGGPGTVDAGSGDDGGPPAVCGFAGEACTADSQCNVWVCSCIGGARGRAQLCARGETCDDGIQACRDFCLPQGVDGTRSDPTCDL